MSTAVAPPASIVIRPNGRLGNQMFQYMLAHAIQARVPGSRIFGHNLPQWTLIGPTFAASDQPHIEFKGQLINIDRIAYLLRTGIHRTLVITGWGMRLEYYEHAETYRHMFRSDCAVEGFDRDHLVIHVRGEDVMRGAHRDYAPMPLSFYETVIRSSGLRPVFVGQIDDGPYSKALRSRFPEAAFPEPSSLIADFERLRSSKNIVLSISSFAWLAAWLSHAQSIHLPIWGLFDPVRRPDIFLLPALDRRYVFHKIEDFEWSGKAEQLEALISNAVATHRLSSDTVAAATAKLMLGPST